MYNAPVEAATIALLIALRDTVIKPLLAATAKPKMRWTPQTWSAIDEHGKTVRKNLQTLCRDVGLVA